MRRISIGTWAYAVGPYARNPIPFGDVVKGLRDLRFDGLDLGAFGPHPTPDSHPTKASRRTLRDLVETNGLAFSGLAPDLRQELLVNAQDDGAAYLAGARKNLEFASDLGITLFRVDTVQPPEILEKVDKTLAMDRIALTWRKACRMAADLGIQVSWEFEPGFVFNRPSDIVALVDAVGERNFGVTYDTCHAYMCGVIGARQTGGPRETAADGMLALARRLRGRINAVRLIDCDGRLNPHGTSRRRVFGEGRIDFPPVLKELTAHSGCPHDWWTLDVCFEEDAWRMTSRCKMAVDWLNAQFGGREEGDR